MDEILNQAAGNILQQGTMGSAIVLLLAVVALLYRQAREDQRRLADAYAKLAEEKLAKIESEIALIEKSLVEIQREVTRVREDLEEIHG